MLSRADVEEAYTDLSLPAGDVHSRDEPGATGTIAAFHERLARQGSTSGALTACPRSPTAFRRPGCP